MSDAALTLSCTRCGAGISNDDLTGGLAVRVDGELVCQMCVDTLPGEAVVRINQVRALRGLEVTTYLVKREQAPKLQLYSFTTSANITSHRRKLATDGFFEAPPLPPLSERQRLPTPPPPPKIVTDRVARGQMPARKPMLIAAGATVVVLAGIALAVALAAPDKKAVVADGNATEVPTPVPPKAMKTRLDYPVDALQAWTLASKDRECPTLVQQSIAQELIRKRTTMLDEADAALEEKRLDDATALANALTLPEDIDFRDVRRRENELRTRLLTARTVASAPKPALPLPAPVAPNPVVPDPVIPPAVPTPPLPAPAGVVVAASDGSLRLMAEDARIEGTKLSLDIRGNIKALTGWQNSEDAPTWKVRIDRPGNFRIEVRTASANTEACLFQVQSGDQRVANVVPPTGAWDKFRMTMLGVIALNTAGEVEIRMGAIDAKTWRGLNVAEVQFHPTNDPPSPPPALPTTAPPVPTPTPPPTDKPIEPTVVVTPWNGAFVTGGRDRAPRLVPLDGSEHVPAGLPGGVAQVFRSGKSQALKRHAAFLDLANAPASGGGVVVLVHPGRNDRNEIVASLTDGKGTTVKFEPVILPDDEWTPLILPVSAAEGLDPSQLLTLALEDGAKAGHIPDDAGFLIATTVTVSGRAPVQTDLALRASALLPDPKRLANLPKLLDILARSRKKPNWQKLIEPARVRFVLGDWGRNQDWRAAMRKQLEPLVPGKQPQTMMTEINFDDGWLDAMTKGKDAALDPNLIHVAVLWTGGAETGVFPAAAQAMTGFWKKRLDQVMGAGILPIVVLGPNLQSAERRAQAEQVWQQVATLAPVRLYGLPVIDLRALPTADDGTWDPATATLAAQLVVDAIGETVFSLRRLGAIK
ncbi:MAG: hypothetical protein H0W78_09715 [Planctomycetes bacterium]|nr:hypothetical protein [Planctomycetota bacterium]